MTDQQIDEMAPGSEMNILIHEKVMDGCIHSIKRNPDSQTMHGDYRFICSKCDHSFYSVNPYPDPDWARDIPAYSTMIEAAWLIVHKVKFPRSTDTSMNLNYIGSDGRWHCQFIGSNGLFGGFGSAIADSPELAICRAALKSLNR